MDFAFSLARNTDQQGYVVGCKIPRKENSPIF